MSLKLAGVSRKPVAAADRIARRVMPKAYRRLRTRAAHGLVFLGRPQVSVVVPVYNVKAYLRPCVRSLLKQSFRRLEIILVDDGSTDGSTEIAKELARANPARVRYIHQPNAGLGAARNAGVKLVRGRYLMFVDSDDTVPRHAVRSMVVSIKRTGSDFVCGAMQRVDNGLKRTPNWVKDLHGRRDLRTTIWQRPDMILNVFAWGKLYSMDFWRRLDLSFPEGVYYEDQMVSARAYLEARSFDVLTDVTYNWYLRTGTSSITQTTADIRNLRDRITVTHQVNQLLRDRGNADIRRWWLDTRILGNDVSLYVKDIDWVTEEYYDEIVRWLAGIFVESDWHSHFDTGPVKRLITWAVLHQPRTVVERLRQLERENPGGLATTVEDGSVFVDLGPGYRESVVGADRQLFRVFDNRLVLSSSLRTLRWVGPGLLELGGWAFIRQIDLADHDTTVTVELRSRDGAVVAVLPTQPTTRFRVTRRSSNRWVDYDPAGFRVTLDLREQIASRRTDEPLQVWVRVSTAGFERSGPWTSALSNGGVKWPVSSPLMDGCVVAPNWRRDILHLDIIPRAAVATDVRADGGDIVVECAGGRPVTRATVTKRVRSRGPATLTATISEPEPGRQLLRFAASAFFTSGTGWRVRAVAGSDEQVPVHLGSGVASYIDLGNGVLARRSPSGNLVLQPMDGTVVVHQDEVGDDTWTISGQAFGADPADLRLVGPRHTLSPERVERSAGGGFVAGFDLRIAEWGPDLRPVAPGFYRLVHLAEEPVKIRWSPDGLRHVPREFVQSRYSVRSTPDQGPVLEILSDVGGDGDSAYYQRVLQQQTYQAAREGARQPAVLFESFHGRNATDNPFAIWKELQERGTELTAYWSVHDSSVWTPPGIRPLVRLSEEWYQVLGSAACLVNNSNFPSFFRKAPDQLYIQTWHGTPLKKIGHDIERVLFSYRNYLEMMDREAASWDGLISPNAFSSAIFPQAFCYEGPLLETGYPRNDALLTGPEEIADRARQRLGLVGDPRKILLYAPTWRDDQFVGRPGRYKAVYHLDFDAFEERFGGEYVVLVRGHSNTMLFGQDVRHGSVIDVTRYPEVADLYCLADVLVTDYSSVMFDYSVTGKPMLFLAPDIADYRDRVRGFYFDFEAESPGPIVMDTPELIAALADLEGLKSTYGSRYAAFRERFNALEDGSAAARVVDTILIETSTPDPSGMMTASRPLVSVEPAVQEKASAPWEPPITTPEP